MLSNLDYEVRFELWQGKVRHGAQAASLSTHDFTQKVFMGNGIGHEDSAGTLGGYINLTNSQGGAKVLGLTNYHVIRTPAMNTSKLHAYTLQLPKIIDSNRMQVVMITELGRLEAPTVP
jgi:hypothetical protein